MVLCGENVFGASRVVNGGLAVAVASGVGFVVRGWELMMSRGRETVGRRYYRSQRSRPTARTASIVKGDGTATVINVHDGIRTTGN